MANPSRGNSPSDKPGSKAWLIGLLVAGLATIGAGAAGEFYKDAKAWVLPGDIFGPYVMLSPNDEDAHEVLAKQIKLKSYGYELWGEASSSEKSWVYAGYMNTGYLVLSYRSRHPLGIGFGEYFFEPKDGERKEFVGHMVGNFCGAKGPKPNRRIMQCNVVMVRGELGSEKESDARKSYSEYLTKPCLLLEEAKQIPLEKCKALDSNIALNQTVASVLAIPSSQCSSAAA